MAFAERLIDIKQVTETVRKGYRSIYP
jgi:hypothetical protein